MTRQSEYKDAFNQFGVKIYKSTVPIALKEVAENPKEYRHFILDTVFEPTKVNLRTPLKLNPQDRLQVDIFFAYKEILQSFRALKDSEFYLGCYKKYPGFKRHGIPHSQYVSYHVEKWLSECYVLHERLVRAFKRLQRQLKYNSSLVSLLDKNIFTFKTSLKSIIEIRGKHTHEVRFSDPEIERMESIELMSKKIRKKIWKAYVQDLLYEDASHAWQSRIRKNNKAINSVLDSIFHDIAKIIFQPDGKLIGEGKRQQEPLVR